MDEPTESGSGFSELVTESISRWNAESDADKVRADADDYGKYVFRKVLFILFGVLLVVIMAGIVLAVGDYDISFTEAYSIVWDYITGHPSGSLEEHIVIELRAPRIAFALIVGASLAVAGAVMQSTLKNPLADPYTTGISSGALLGATLAMTTGSAVAIGEYAVVVNAFIFSLIPTAVIVAVSKLRGGTPTVMIMAGIAVMYIFNAFSTVMMLWADPNDLEAVYQWQVGTLAYADWDAVPVMLAVSVGGILTMQLLSRKLNILAIGDENAKSMGVDAENLRILSMVVVALMCAVVVSFTGLIGFVGLVVPHIVRIFVGSDNRFLIPASAVFGMLLVLAADLVGRTAIAPAVLQVGVVTAFLGGPLFLWLIVFKKSKVW